MSDWFENGCGERSVDTVEELQEQDAEAKALRSQTVRLGLGHFEDQALGAEFGKVVAQLAQTVAVGGYAERFRGALMQVTGTKPAAAREMTEARECLHDGQ